MGQAFDHDGRVLGDAHGATKKEVFDTLNERHPNAAEIRVMPKALADSQGVDMTPPHTKLNPGPYDCYAKLALDEPYFVLRAKDPAAPAIVEAWAGLRNTMDANHANPKINEAREIATQMRYWRRNNIIDTLKGPVKLDHVAPAAMERVPTEDLAVFDEKE